MNDSLYKALLETSWRRKLTPEEDARLQEYLVTHPEAQAEWEEEAALNFHLERLPDAPLSSNFTARVLQEVELEEAREKKEYSFSVGSWWQRWIKRHLPQTATVMLLFALLAFGFQQHKASTRRQVADSVGKFYSATAVFPMPEVFGDFEVIHQLGQVQPVSDEELLAALQ